MRASYYFFFYTFAGRCSCFWAFFKYIVITGTTDYQILVKYKTTCYDSKMGVGGVFLSLA